MSTGASSPPAKMFLLAKDGTIINMDYVVRIYIAQGTGKLQADMNTGSSIELPGVPAERLRDLARLLPFNTVVL